MKCKICHNSVTTDHKFCPHCGNRMLRRPSAGQGPTLSLKQGMVLLLFGLFFGYAFFYVASDSGKDQAATAPSKNKSTVTSVAVNEIASEFMCPCGSCNDVLDQCTCEHENGAVEVKGFIAGKIAEGHKKPHIIQLVRDQFNAQPSEAGTLVIPKPPIN